MLRENRVATYHIDGAAFRRWREATGRGLRECARDLGISATYLSRIERTAGETRLSVDLAERFKQIMEGERF